MKKRTWLLFLISAVIILLLNVSLAEEAWDRDEGEHWKINESGEKTSAGAHKVTDFVCEICQSNIWPYEDGTVDITNFNELGDMTRYSYYDETGALADDYVYAYTYDENGMKKTSMTYYFGILVEECTHGADPFGESITLTCISYSDDGSESSYLSDEYGNIVSSVFKDAAGNILYEETYAYTYDADGFPTYTIKRASHDDGTKFLTETDALGNPVVDIQYAPDGSIVYEYHYAYEFDEGGRMVREVMSEDGKPIFESRYAYTDDLYDFWGYQCMTIDYLEGGGKTVCELDEFGDILSETTYDKDGNIIS